MHPRVGPRHLESPSRRQRARGGRPGEASNPRAHLHCVSSARPACCSCHLAIQRGCTLRGHLHGDCSSWPPRFSSRHIQHTSSFSCAQGGRQGRGRGARCLPESQRRARQVNPRASGGGERTQSAVAGLHAVAAATGARGVAPSTPAPGRAELRRRGARHDARCARQHAPAPAAQCGEARHSQRPSAWRRPRSAPKTW